MTIPPIKQPYEINLNTFTMDLNSEYLLTARNSEDMTRILIPCRTEIITYAFLKKGILYYLLHTFSAWNCV
jgi:hypothetical protein